MAHIMILDDVKDFTDMLTLILERAGHTVSAFNDEDQSLAFAQTHHPDAAILDIKLKRLSGVKMLEELKKRLPELKVMMLTGYPTLESAKNALNLGAAAYCVKPFDRAELVEKVREMLSSPAS